METHEVPLSPTPRELPGDLTRLGLSTGELEVYTLQSGGLVLANAERTVRSTWDAIIPGSFAEFGEHTDLLFYDRAAGLGEFYVTDPRGALQLLRRHTNFRTVWDVIVSGRFVEGSVGDSLLFYDREAGQGEFFGTDGHGAVSLAAQHRNWRRTWSHIIPGRFDRGPSASGFDSLLFYERATGQAEFYATDGRGGMNLLARHTNWRRTWDAIIPYTDFENDNRTILVFYDRAAGVGEFYATDGRGGMNLLARHTNWRRSWDVIIRARPSSSVTNGLLFYDRSAGVGELYAVDGSGRLSLVSSHSNWRRTWNAIVSGTFVGIGEPSLLFYER